MPCSAAAYNLGGVHVCMTRCGCAESYGHHVPLFLPSTGWPDHERVPLRPPAGQDACRLPQLQVPTAQQQSPPATAIILPAIAFVTRTSCIGLHICLSDGACYALNEARLCTSIHHHISKQSGAASVAEWSCTQHPTPTVKLWTQSTQSQPARLMTTKLWQLHVGASLLCFNHQALLHT